MAREKSVSAEGVLIQNPDADVFQLLGLSPSLTAVNQGPLDFNLDDYAGQTFAGKPIFTLSQIVPQIDSGQANSVNGGMITYSFTEKNHLTGIYNNPNYGFTAGFGLSPFSAEQRAEARQAVQFWDDVIAPRFVEKNGMGADIIFANSWDPAQAYAYYPTTTGHKYQSDVFVADPAVNWTNGWLDLGGYGATTLVHELGHTIGLSHPGNYNYDPNLPLSYANYAEYAQDSTQYSIMSYWGSNVTGASWVNWGMLLNNYEQTPMIHDIMVAQLKYGADLTTRTGDTVYGFNSNAGRDVYDFSQNKYPALAIYDAGGNDTIDLSGFNASVFLDLHDGQFSSAGQAIPTAVAVNANIAAFNAAHPDAGLGPVTQAQMDTVGGSRMALAASKILAETGVEGVRATEFDNISIAYGVIIENGIGGSQRDVLWGNAANNVLKGMGGDDVLNGFEGRDTLYGGAGVDTFQFHVVEKGDVIADFAADETIDLTETGVDFTWIGGASFSNSAGELRYAGGKLEGDVNGDGHADLSITVLGAMVLESNLLLM